MYLILSAALLFLHDLCHEIAHLFGGRIFISCFWILGGTQSSAGFRTIRRSLTARSSALCSIVWMPQIASGQLFQRNISDARCDLLFIDS